MDMETDLIEGSWRRNSDGRWVVVLDANLAELARANSGNGRISARVVRRSGAVERVSIYRLGVPWWDNSARKDFVYGWPSARVFGQ